MDRNNVKKIKSQWMGGSIVLSYQKFVKIRKLFLGTHSLLLL